MRISDWSSDVCSSDLLLGRIPSAVGYQPTLSADMGALQERIASAHKGSITSVQAIYVPADDLTDPAPATSFAHLDATTTLRSEEHTSELQSLMRISYAVFCLKKKITTRSKQNKTKLKYQDLHTNVYNLTTHKTA